MTVTLPTADWRGRKAGEQAEVARGDLAPDAAYMEPLFPTAFVDRTEALLRAFEASLGAKPTSADACLPVMKHVETLVVAPNHLNDEDDGSAIETGEREQLCGCISDLVVARGIDIEALAISQGCPKEDVVERWREW